MKTSFYAHEQEVANGWDSTPTGGHDLIGGIAMGFDYSPEVMELMSGVLTDEEYLKKYASAKQVINKMTNNRKKGRKSVSAMRDIVTAFPNKDNTARIFRAEGVDVNLFNKDQRSINRISDHEPDFVMSKKNMFGITIKRNVKLHFTTNKLDGRFLIEPDKFIKYFQKDTTILIINTNTKQFGVIDTTDKMMVKDLKYEFFGGKHLASIPYRPKRVALMSEGNMKPIINDLF